MDLNPFKNRWRKIPFIAASGFLSAFLLGKALIFESLVIPVAVIILATMIVLPIFVYKTSKATKDDSKQFSLVAYFVLWFLFALVGVGAEDSLRTPFEQRIVSEKERKERIAQDKAAVAKLRKEQAKAVKRAQYLKSYEYALSVNQISAEFDANSARAEDKYMGKRILVSGLVGGIDDAPFGKEIIFSIKGYKKLDCRFGSCDYVDSGGSVTCYLDRKKKQYSRFNRGEKVKMIGTVSSEELGVAFKDCIFP